MSGYLIELIAPGEACDGQRFAWHELPGILYVPKAPPGNFTGPVVDGPVIVEPLVFLREPGVNQLIAAAARDGVRPIRYRLQGWE